MHGIQPTGLSNEELVRLAWAAGPEALSPLWVKELILRLENAIDEIQRLETEADALG